VGQGSVVVGADVQLVEVLQEQWPLRGVQLGDLGGGLDLEVALLLQRANIIAVQGLLLDLLLLLACFCGQTIRKLGVPFNSSLFRLTHVGHFNCVCLGKLLVDGEEPPHVLRAARKWTGKHVERAVHR